MLLMFSEGQKAIDNGAREPRLFELDNGPLIHVEVNMEELPIFLFKSRDRVEESLEVRNTIITEDGRRLEQYSPGEGKGAAPPPTTMAEASSLCAASLVGTGYTRAFTG